MSERPKLNSRLVKNWLKSEDRKQSYLVKKLDVSGSLLAKMLSGNRVPQEETLIRLATLIGCTVNDLLMQSGAKRAG